MSGHDRKLTQTIDLELDLEGKRSGHTTVKTIRDRVRLAYPARKWHPMEHHEAENAHLARRIKERMQVPLSQEYIDKNLPKIKHKDRLLLGRVTAWFWVRSLQEWVFSLHASPEQWEEGELMRIDMANKLIEMATDFRERADMLRMERAASLYELITRP